MIQLYTYLITPLLVMLLGVVILAPGPWSALAQTANETNEQVDTFKEGNQSINRNFFEFNTEIPAFNVSLFPPDQFSLSTIEANQNDNVTVDFYNMEAPTGD